MKRQLAGATCLGILGAGLFAAPAPSVDGTPFNDATCTDFEPVDPPPAWQVERLQLDSPSMTVDGTGVTVAVIDTGIDTADNPALAGTVRQQFDFAESSDEIDCQHGTQVASLIAGQNDPEGTTAFQGVAPGVTLIGLRALSSATDGEGNQQPEPLEPTIQAIDKAIELDADIINISQQGSDTSSYRAAINRAVAAGIVVVAAAGNQGKEGSLPFPAAYPGVMGVGMTNLNDVAHESSQSHPDLEVSVAGPGVDVLVANPSAGAQSWEAVTGTSFAAPQVAGAAALLLESEPQLTPEEVAARLEQTADPPAGAVPDPQLGYGIVNPANALTEVPMAAEPPPVASQPPESAPHPDDRATPDNTARNLALGFGATALVLAIGGAGSVAAVRTRNSRR